MTIFNQYELIARFISQCPEHYAAMKKSDHNYSNDDLNPFHVEGDVWTHTMAVMTVARIFNYPLEVQLACLLHDVGKAYTRQVEPRVRDGIEVNYVSYKGHDGVSFYHTVDILNNVYADITTEEQRITIAKLVALHSNLYTWQNGDSDVSDDKLRQAYAGDSAFLSLLSMLARCDADGRIHKGKTRSVADEADGTQFLKYNDFTTYQEFVEDADKPVLSVLVGPPCSGKSTYIKEVVARAAIIISRDEIVMEQGGSDSYSENWHRCDHKEVDQILLKRFQAAITTGIDVIIDMTNMSKKSRRKWLNPAKRAGYQTEAVVFHTGHEEMLARNIKRNEETKKFIREDIFHTMETAFSYPLCDEFDIVSEFTD